VPGYELARIAASGENAGPPVSQLNGGNRVKKVLQPIKNVFKQAKANPLIAIPVALLLVLLVAGVAVLVAAGGDDNGDSTKNGAAKTERGHKAEKSPGVAKGKKRKFKPAPVVSGAGTLDTARSVGTFAVAQGRGRIKNPSSVSVRVSAAPKQEVTVDYQLSCYKEGAGAKIGQDRYRTHPPDIRSLPLPISGAQECTVTVGAQLTSHRPGRVKVAIISG
jgi:hypothetical protein